jgi:hypothetical protein
MFLGFSYFIFKKCAKHQNEMRKAVIFDAHLISTLGQNQKLEFNPCSKSKIGIP